MTPAGLRKAARGSAGTRKLVGIAPCKQSPYGYDGLWEGADDVDGYDTNDDDDDTRAIKLVSPIITIWSAVTPDNTIYNLCNSLTESCSH